MPAMVGLGGIAGIAGWLIWRQPDGGRAYRQALNLWGCQIGLSALWGPLFFGMRLFLPALGVAITVVASALLTVFAFANRSRPAASLMLPGALAAVYAAYLNAGFWWLNR
jgi:tryptophan-rich sensory protein